MPTMNVAYDDAWGEEDEEVQAVPIATSRNNAAALRNLQAQRLHSSKHASVSSSNATSDTGAPSLHAYCLGCLGPYIEALVEHGGSVLPFLPAESKSSLLAIARRQGLLRDETLKLLVDSIWTSLDISFSSVTNDGLLYVMKSLPALLHLDITGCYFTTQTLQALSQHCLQLQVLRIGSAGKSADDIYSSAIKRLMPKVASPGSASDSWETSFPDEKPAAASAPHGFRALDDLTYLLWPTIPTKAAGLLARKFPKVIVNPRPGSCPSAADSSTALDELAIQAVAPFWQLEEEQTEEAAEQQPLIPLSERFRMAYASRAQRLAAKAERNYQQQQRRRLRNDTVLQALAKFKYL